MDDRDDRLGLRSLRVRDLSTDNCSVARALGVVGEKWSLPVLRDVTFGVTRFDDLQRRTGASRQVLTDRLARLVEAGVLRRVEYREDGQRRRYEYRLTDAGLELVPVLTALREWGDRWLADPEGPPVELEHHGCGEPVHLELRCGAGHRLDSPAEARPRPGPGARAAARAVS